MSGLGDLISFDGNNDFGYIGIIVERATDNYLYIIEGNSNNECGSKKYKLNYGKKYVIICRQYNIACVSFFCFR